MLDALCKQGRTAEAPDLMEAMRDTEVKSLILSPTILFNLWILPLRPMEGSNQLLDKTKDEGNLPNVVTFSTLVDALCRERWIEEALSSVTSNGSKRSKTECYNLDVFAICIV
ncbi:hypothetical protein FNV43_RR01261 [Rhamnella rubrinervis]|uniref:Pentatricopeptide repeat-containing protein n=1 Tax=Rhamnella rubrinervis TaxID=2594499 RepID=A0A8K0MS45_9ROSA|nr:hypothetical protein FNV43_RR01261 [Rhamnella rubrinervis]